MDTESTPRSEMRASDADRDTAVQRLSEAMSEGRLTPEEHDQRLSSAMGATTLGDLDALTGDLPGPDPQQIDDRDPVDLATADTRKSSMRWHNASVEWRSWLSGVVVLTGIWGVSSVMSGAIQPFWPVIPLGVWGVIALTSAISNCDIHDGPGT